MDFSLRWRAILAVAVIVMGLALALPSLPGVKGSFLNHVLPDNTIRLGLDLKGGIFLTLEVNTQKALEERLERMAQDLKAEAEDQGIGFLNPKMLDGERIRFLLHDQASKPALEEILKKYEIFNITTREVEGGGLEYTMTLDSDWKDQFYQSTIEQTVNIVRNRIDRRGVVEPDIRQQEGGRIQIQMPGLEDAREAIDVITTMGHLEFKLEAADVTVEEARQQPDKYEVVYPDEKSNNPLVLLNAPVLTGEHVADAQPKFGQRGEPYVLLELTSRGGDIFQQVTRDNVNKRLAIILDNEVHSAPNIQEEIGGGRASITGNFTVQETKDLVNVLKDALPAPVNKVAESAIGPSLGQESINKGTMAAAIGLIVVLIFMVVYYGFSGLVADFVLCLNIVFILGGLALFEATLTLPGIAGIILTIGMAVDANVIIFERIREELRRGLTAKAAIQEGYARATLTILDANVTTVIAAMILYQFGTGPIRGFAVTLTLGIITSMFTAIFVSRILFDISTARRASGARLSI